MILFNIFEVHFEFHMQMCKTIQKNRGGGASTYLYHTLLELHFHSESNAHRQQHFGAQGYFVGISVGTEKKPMKDQYRLTKTKNFHSYQKCTAALRGQMDSNLRKHQQIEKRCQST